MTRTAALITFLVVALAALPAHAQRVFVSGSGLDSNPCTFPQPCRTFQQAFNTVAANGEIDVLDPAGYGPLTITHGISIQAHGFGGITQTNGSTAAVTINAGASDAVNLNGLLIDGGGTGQHGINISAAGSVQILGCVIRHFAVNGINVTPPSDPITLLVSDTVASDNADDGIGISPLGSAAVATLKRVTANNNAYGVSISNAKVIIADSVLSNNSTYGLYNHSTTWLGRSKITANSTGIFNFAGVIDTFGDNDINGNTTADITGTGLTPTSTQ